LAIDVKILKIEIMIPVKCLTARQMAYIEKNYEKMSARQMADKLQVESYKVTLFCNVNAYEPLPSRKIPERTQKVVPGSVVKINVKGVSRLHRYY
jgi:hypothetical protein